MDFRRQGKLCDKFIVHSQLILMRTMVLTFNYENCFSVFLYLLASKYKQQKTIIQMMYAFSHQSMVQRCRHYPIIVIIRP
ncbi:hypothetical protein BD408DRAFT_413909 [Parasitella parasitica]|nr:hypothetical protein BD408DRAFT_413909 [Parasitella parasitica]